MIELIFKVKEINGNAFAEVLCNDQDVTPLELAFLKQQLPNLNSEGNEISSSAEKILAKHLNKKE